MKKQLIIIYTMKGCPYCVMMKEQLQSLNIEFIERDIDKEEKEFEMYSKAVGGNDSVPAIMIIEVENGSHKSHFYAPEKHFEKIEDGVRIIKEHREKFSL
jgi:glutaredoxin